MITNLFLVFFHTWAHRRCLGEWWNDGTLRKKVEIGGVTICTGNGTLQLSQQKTALKIESLELFFAVFVVVNSSISRVRCIFGFRKTIAVLQDLELISKGNDVFVFVMSQSVTVQMMAGWPFLMCRMRWLLCALLQLTVLRVDASKVHGVSKWVVHRHPCVGGGQSHCCISFSMPCQGHSLTKAQWQPACPVSCQPLAKSLDMIDMYRIL